MRYDLQKAFDVIEACAILHNLSIKWNDIMPRWMYDDGEDGRELRGADDVVIDYNALPRFYTFNSFFGLIPISLFSVGAYAPFLKMHLVKLNSVHASVQK
jgi:hypothetical protein